MTHKSSVALLARILAAMAMTCALGCSTYVNIPQQPGDIASHNPDRGGVVDAQSAALAAIIASHPLPSPVTIQLVPGTAPDSYARALPKIGDAVVKHEGDDTPDLDVRRVLIRGWVAQVDVILASGGPEGEPQRQLLTAYLNWKPFSGWSVRRIKTWRIPIDEALLQSRRAAEVSISE